LNIQKPSWRQLKNQSSVKYFFRAIKVQIFCDYNSTSGMFDVNARLKCWIQTTAGRSGHIEGQYLMVDQEPPEGKITADWVLDHYNFARAKGLLSLLPGRPLMGPIYSRHSSHWARSRVYRNITYFRICQTRLHLWRLCGNKNSNDKRARKISGKATRATKR
jgi:hypothetical protein